MSDELYMRRCLELALLGSGNVSPNPMVGCVIVLDDVIIGEGYHVKFGQAHAEVNAINSVFKNFPEKAAQFLSEATVYVSLEPCAHFGKTPPCADLLIKHRVKKVVVGNRDPFSEVNGRGIDKLKNAGIAVTYGVLDLECKQLNRRFFTRVTQQRPYIILKWAETANGFFAPLTNVQRWISSPLARKIAHKWRSEEDAILVGKKTVLADNPQLNARDWNHNNPVRLVIDKNLEITTEYKVYNTDAKTIIFNEVKTEVQDNVHYIQMEDMHFYLPQKIAYQLYLMDIQSVIIEGGANILNQFIESGLWDESRVFSGHVNWENGTHAPRINGILKEVIQLNEDKLLISYNTN